MMAQTGDLGSSTLEGRKVTLHIVLNNKYSFTISNFAKTIDK